MGVASNPFYLLMMVFTDKKKKKYELRHKYDGVSKEERDRLTADLRRKRKTAHEKRRKERREIEHREKMREDRINKIMSDNK